MQDGRLYFTWGGGGAWTEGSRLGRRGWQLYRNWMGEGLP